MEETNEAWKLLLESLNNKNIEILQMKKREIELLQKLMKTEENTRNLIKIVAELKLPPKNEPDKQTDVSGNKDE